MAEEPRDNVTLQMPRSFNRRADFLAYALRDFGIRTSKTELIAMTTSTLPTEVTQELIDQLLAFRGREPS